MSSTTRCLANNTTARILAEISGQDVGCWVNTGQTNEDVAEQICAKHLLNNKAIIDNCFSSSDKQILKTIQRTDGNACTHEMLQSTLHMNGSS